MEFDLNITTLNGTQAAIYSTESQKSGCPAAAPPLPPGSTVPSRQQSSSEKIEQFVAKFNRVSIESAPQAEVVQKLAEQIEGLPADRQAEKFKELFKIAGRVPEQGLKIQQGMIRSIDKLTSMQRRPLYDFVYDDARRRSIAQGSTWAAVASLLSADIPDPSLQEDSDGKKQRKWKRTQFKSIKDAALGDIKSVVSELNWTDRADVITELAKVPPNFHYSRTRAHNYNRPAMEKRYKELEEYMQSLPLRDRVNPAKYLEKATKYLSGNKRPDRLEKLEYLKTPYNRLPAELVSLIAEFLSIEDFDKFQEINKNQNRQRSDFLLREKQLKKLDKIFPLLERVFQVGRSEIKKRVQEGTGLTVLLQDELKEFQGEELVEKIKELFKKAKNNTEYGAEIQEFLVNSFDKFKFDPEERADLFNFFFEEADQYVDNAGKLWIALAAKLPNLNQDEQECIRGHKILLRKLHLPMAISEKKEFIRRLIAVVDNYNFSISQQEKFVRFQRLFQAAEGIQGGIDLQREVVEKLEVLTGEPRFQLFHFIYEKVQDQPPRNSDEENFLFEIGKQLALSTNDRYVDKYSDFVKYKLPLLNPAQRAELIPMLLENVKQSDSVFSEYAYENHSIINVEKFTEIAKKLYEITKELPPPYQGKPIGRLAEIVSNINSEDKVPFYQDVCNLAASLPDDQLCIALPGLVEGLMALPIDEHRRADEFNWLNGPLARVGPEHRVQAALNLLRNVDMVKENTFLFEWMWQSAVNLLHGTGENKLFEVLSELRKLKTLCFLDDNQWRVAEGEIRDFMDRHQFSSQARAQIDNNIPWLRQKPNLL